MGPFEPLDNIPAPRGRATQGGDFSMLRYLDGHIPDTDPDSEPDEMTETDAFEAGENRNVYRP